MVQETDGGWDVSGGESLGTQQQRVREVKSLGPTVLVELEDEEYGQQYLIPSEAVVDGYCSSDDLEMAIPYGVAWDEVIEITLTPEEVCTALRKKGIYTKEDFNNRYLTVQNVALKLVMADIIKAFKELDRED